MGKKSNPPNSWDLTDVLLWVIFTAFKIYSVIATVVLRIFFPVTKYLVNKKLASFDIHVGKDIVVHNETRFYTRLAIEGSFGLMEGRIDKDWSTEDFQGMIEKILASRRLEEVKHPLTWIIRVFNLQTKNRSFQVGKNHYDDCNEIIEAMLDSNLQYTCGYWKLAKNLDESQIAKMDLIARKLQLKPGMRVLDIGSGYGTLGYYLAKNYGISFVGITISKEQVKYANKLCEGLDCEFRLQDYRDLDEKFDRIVSVGMFEHTGQKNYKTFFEVCHRCLEDDGIFLLHTIGTLHKMLFGGDLFVHKYVFKNGYVPFYMEICKGFEDLFIIEDWHNFGFDYSKTLAAWEQNFDRAWPKFEKKYGDKFHIMWKTYLQSAQACFTTRSLHLWQIVLSKDGLKQGYHAPR